MVVYVHGMLHQGEDEVGIHDVPLPPLKRPGQLVLVGPPQTPNMVDVVECQLKHNKHEATSKQVLVVWSSKHALEVWLDVKCRAVAERGPQWLQVGAVEDDVVMDWLALLVHTSWHTAARWWWVMPTTPGCWH